MWAFCSLQILAHILYVKPLKKVYSFNISCSFFRQYKISNTGIQGRELKVQHVVKNF